MQKIKKTLTKKQIKRLRDILEKEIKKSKNSKYYANLCMLIEDLEEISFHELYLSLIAFIKYYRTKIDMEIKRRLKNAYSNRQIDLEIYKKEAKQKFHKYIRNEFINYLKRSEYFFDKYITPFSFYKKKNIKKDKYMNRIYLGLGFEFLLKAIYLKKGYLINEVNSKLLDRDGILEPDFPIKLGVLKKKYLKPKTVNFGILIDHLHKLLPKKIDIRDYKFYIELGLIIVQYWRNQDIHTPTGLFKMGGLQYQNINNAYHNLHKIFFPKKQIKKFPRN